MLAGVTVRCDNPECPRYREQRVAPLTPVGDGLYPVATIYCDCGFQVRWLGRPWFQGDLLVEADEVERRPAAPTEDTSRKSRGRQAVKSAPERR